MSTIKHKFSNKINIILVEDAFLRFVPSRYLDDNCTLLSWKCHNTAGTKLAMFLLYFFIYSSTLPGGSCISLWWKFRITYRELYITLAEDCVKSVYYIDRRLYKNGTNTTDGEKDDAKHHVYPKRSF